MAFRLRIYHHQQRRAARIEKWSLSSSWWWRRLDFWEGTTTADGRSNQMEMIFIYIDELDGSDGLEIAVDM